MPATYHEKSDSEIQILDALVQMASRWQVFANNQGTPVGLRISKIGGLFNLGTLRGQNGSYTKNDWLDD